MDGVLLQARKKLNHGVALRALSPCGGVDNSHTLVELPATSS